jgi:hypothetical protein
MNQLTIKILFVLTIFLLVGLNSDISAQMSDDLKKFLWEKNFEELISEYAEEKVILREAGDFEKRIERRSFIETNGYRVQAFAGSDQENAENMATNVLNLKLDSVYVIEEAGLYKVQIGNFTERLEAEKMLDLLRFQNISNCWIVETIIHIPKQPAIHPKPVTTEKKLTTAYFTIQLFVTKNQQRAREFSEIFSRDTGDPSRLIQKGEFWKVLSGTYSQESSARQRLEEIRNSGYPDAWITQISD